MTIDKRILIVEDKVSNLHGVEDLRAAGLTVDVVGQFDEAMGRLYGRDSKYDQINSEPLTTTPYDVVMTDLFFPFGRENSLMDKSQEREVFPLGFPMLFAAARAKVPIVGMLTDLNHHDHPIANTFDYLFQSNGNKANLVPKTRRPIYKLDDTLVALCDERDVPHMYAHGEIVFRDWDEADKFAESEVGTTDYQIVGRWKAENIINGKDYFAFYQKLKTFITSGDEK